jgi:hypothetical protein
MYKIACAFKCFFHKARLKKVISKSINSVLMRNIMVRRR